MKKSEKMSSCKNGIAWEDATVNDVTVDDLDAVSLNIFRSEALKKGRMPESELNVSNEELLKKLRLMRDGLLTRAAVLLFYSDPQIVQSGSFIKIGKFYENGCVAYHHELKDSLMVNAHKIFDFIYLMYLRAKISYDRGIRVEEYPFDYEVLRESIYNAMVNNCYMYGIPIQIKISEETLSITNRCILPDGWSVDMFKSKHDSIPYNSNIANVFYLAGFIEKKGTGINVQTMPFSWCKAPRLSSCGKIS